jgi:hypothetical protein
MGILNGRWANHCLVNAAWSMRLGHAAHLRCQLLRGRWNGMRRGGALFVFGLRRARGLRPLSCRSLSHPRACMGCISRQKGNESTLVLCE